MSSAAKAIPYEKQSEALTGRACGAACLSMVYRSLGMEVAQDEIWPAIAKENHLGQVSSTTYLMARDALNRGFSAVAIQAQQPLHALRVCRAAGICAILNHRVRRDSAAGHYTVLVDIDDKKVVVHDPLLGAGRSVSHAELMELWLPRGANSEIAGAVLIAICGPELAPVTDCKFCRTPIPLRVDCPQCQKPTNLHPAAVLGCINLGCVARLWNWVCCPSCDYAFTFHAGAKPAAAPKAATPPPDAKAIPQVDVAKLFAEIDKFTALLQSVPAAANHPEVKKQLEFIASGKEQFKAAYEKEVARRAALVDQLTQVQEKHEQEKAAQLRKAEELNNPLAPIDGDALARALLSNVSPAKK
jgi:hypothetical protein